MTARSRSNAKRSRWMSWPPGNAPVWILTAIMAITTVTLYGTILPADAIADGLNVPWWMLVLAFVAAEFFVVHIPVGRNTYSTSLSEIPVTLSLVSIAPTTGVLVRILGSGTGLVLARVRGVKLAFNLATVALEMVVAALVFRALLGGHSVLEPRGWLAALAASLAVALLASTLVAVAIALDERKWSGRILLDVLTTTTVGAVANTAVAIITLVVLDEDPRAAVAIVVIAAFMLSAQYSWSSLNRRHAHLQMLYDFTKKVSDHPDGPGVARSVLSEARRVLRGSVGELVLFAGPDLPPARVRLDASGDLAADTDPASPCWWRAIGPDRGVRLPRRTRDPEARQLLAELGLEDAVIAPVRSSGGFVGAILVGNRLDDVSTFDDDDVRLLETLASHAGIELENGKLVDRLRLEAAEKEHQALHDQLTGLPNRRCFVASVRKSLGRGQETAVMLMDLDRFKEINDTLGHAAGDRVLTAVAARIASVLGDGVLTARFGGDEFAVLLPTTSRADIHGAGSALLEALAQPLTLEGLAVDVGASIGVAIASVHGDEADLLIQRADVAMYVAKEQQTGLEVYSAERDVNDIRRLSLVAELRQDIADGRLGVAYQVKCDIATGEIVGIEALARWRSETYGVVPPDEFLPIAECTGLVQPLMQQVLHQALGQTAQWRRQGHNVSIAVNVSVRGLLDATLPDLVASELAEARLAPETLTIEITESNIMRDPDRILAVLTRLSDMGVQLSIDDFGTGYSSLGYLRRLPVREVKIDRTFVVGMASDAADRAIVQAIIGLGHELGLRVVAEGVEDEDTLALLGEVGCDAAQGFLLGRPMRATDLGDALDGDRFPAIA